MSNLLPTILPYIPLAVVRAVFLNALPTKPQAERSSAAVLFADVSGFTPLTEALAQKGPEGPEELTRLLNGYFSRMIAILESEGGEVVKFSGDAVTVLFPATNEPLSHALRRAYQAALAMQDAMVEFAQLETSIGAVALGLKIGIGAGEVLSMQIGGVLERWEYVIAGDPLRQVAEAEHQAQRGDIILSPEAKARIHPTALSPCALSPPNWALLSDLAAVESSLRRYLPRALHGWLSEELRDWLALLRPMSVLFIGIGGIDYAQPDATFRLHTFLRTAQETIYYYEGSINKLAVDDKGTVLMVLFGAPPFAHEDDACRAARCALDLQAVATPQELRLAVGVTSGQVFAGPVGSQSRREYTVMGDTVNLAARLMQKASGGGILCDFNTYRQACPQLAFESLTPMRLKGKAGLIRVYRPTGEAVGLPSVRLGFSSKDAPPKNALVGRQAEIAILKAALDVVEAGESRVLIIEGEAGIGKSRLVEEFIQLVQERGLTGLLGFGRSIEQHTPYRAWRDIFTSYFALSDSEANSTLLYEGLLIELVQEVAPDQMARLPLLNQMLKIHLPDNELTGSLEPSLRQQNLTLLLLALLRAWAKERPLILVLEDAHWLDSLSWELTVQVARALMASDTPMLLLLVTRPFVQKDASHLMALRAMETTQTLHLETLSPAQTVALVTNRLGLAAGSLPEAIAALVCQQAEGNPFFAQELIFTLRDRGIIDPRDASTRGLIRGNLEEATQTLPNTLQGLILARIDRLSPEKQLTLKVAAVIGRSFAYAPLHYLLNKQSNIVEESLKEHLSDLTEYDLTRLETPAAELSYIFKHIITQEVAYQTLLFAQRRQLHRSVAEWYEITFTELAPYYPLLVYHYQQAKEVEREAHFAKLAGEQAAKQFANAEAVRYISRALSLTPAQDFPSRYDLLLSREKIYDLQGARELQKQDLTTLAALAEMADAEQQTEVLIRQAHYAEKISDYPSAIAAAQAAIEIAQTRADKSSQAAGLIRWGRVLYHQGNSQAAQCQFIEALHLYHEISDPWGESDTLNNLGTISAQQGEVAAAKAYFEKGLTIKRTIGDQRGEAAMLGNLAIAFKSQDDYAQASSYEQQALHIKRTIGDRQGEGITLINLAASSQVQGDYVQARTYYDSALRIARSVGDRHSEGLVLANMASFFHNLGDNETAKDYSQEALKITQEIGSGNFKVLALTNLSHALAALAISPKPPRATNRYGQPRGIAPTVPSDKGLT
jgi:class 3 adenylate cyclase/tetratricopeptide (TPR) repeat protein